MDSCIHVTVVFTGQLTGLSTFTFLFSQTQKYRNVACKTYMSPILFNLFVNDLPAFIAVVQEGVQFGESLLSCLLYADDLVILAENEETMQALLKKVGDWCSVWGISVNSNKSAVVHFHQPTLPLTDV